MNSFAKIELPISVVIATLGGDVLKDTIFHLNHGEGIPKEILVCIPEADILNANCVANYKNVHIVQTTCRGQVAQRAVGLAMAANPYIMQLDDDVILTSKTVMVIYDTLLAIGPGNIVAPFFRILPTGEEGTRHIGGWRGFLRNCHAYLVCGAPFDTRRFGKISSSGIGFGILNSSTDIKVIESEWLPGGVVLCHKEDVITDNYYPFPGKAFSEDLVHSILWRRNGCRLWTTMDACAFINVTVESFSWKNLCQRCRAHEYVAKLSDGNVWRTRLWFVLYCVINFKNIMIELR